MSAHRRGRHRRHGLDAAWHWLIVNLRHLLTWLTVRPAVITTASLFTLFCLI